MNRRVSPIWKKLDQLVASRFFYPAACSLAALACYLPLLSKEISIANFGLDGGELVAAAVVRGIGHPTGYPTYLLLIQGILSFAGSSPYWKASLLSATAAAGAVFLVCWIAQRVSGGNRTPAILVGPLALIGTQWFASQAVIAEVNTLNVVFVLLSLVWAIKLPEWQKSGRSRLQYFLIPLLCGVGLGNHLTAGLALLPVAWEFARVIFQRQKIAWSIQQGAGFACGLLVYAYLPLAASRFPPVNWGNPQALPGLWWLISANLYQGLPFSLPVSEFLERLAMILRMVVDQFSVPGILAAGVGFVRLNTGMRFKTGWILAAFIIFSADYQTNDSIVYLLPAWTVIALWLAIGASSIIGFKVKRIHIGLWLITIGIFVTGVLGIGYEGWNLIPRIDPRRDQETVKFTRAFETLPANALVLTSTDADSFPLWYDQLALGHRPDLKIVVLALTRYTWYQQTLQHTYPELVLPSFGEWSPGSRLWGDALPPLNPALPICRTTVEGSSRVMRCGNRIIYQGEMLQEGWK